MAIINVSPSTNITALIASAAVSEGDVLLLEGGTYNQAVVISKNYIRIVSRDGNAVFEGRGTLADAFTLNGVTGVEIHGVFIRNYVSTGILIIGGTANRILCNTISNIVLGRGIATSTSSANLIWNNRIRSVVDGVLLISGSTSNWVIENSSVGCTDDGFESFFPEDANNAFIGNTAVDCGGNGFEMFGANTLAFRNEVVNASSAGYLISSGANSLVIRSRGENGNIGAYVNGNNAFVASSAFLNNRGTGVQIFSDFNIIVRNLIAFNRGNGLTLETSANDNFIYLNKIMCNTPSDIVDNGSDNNFLRNITGCDGVCTD